MPLFHSSVFKTLLALGACLGLALFNHGHAKDAHSHGHAENAHSHGHAKGAHSHGHAELELSLEGRLLTGHLHGAMDNFLPFEHSPKTDAQREQVAALQAKLKDARWLVIPAQAAGCAQKSMKAESKMFEGKPYKGHADLHVQFVFECQAPERLSGVELSVFRGTERLKKLKVEWALPAGQGAADITAKNPKIKF